MFILVALRQRKKDTAKNNCDKTDTKTVIFFLLLISKGLTAVSSVADFETKILILELKKTKKEKQANIRIKLV